MGVPCGGRLIHSARRPLEERLHLGPRVACEQVIDRSRPFLRGDGSGVAFAMVLLQAGELLLARGMVPQQQPRGVREGPRAIGMAALRA